VTLGFTRRVPRERLIRDSKRVPDTSSLYGCTRHVIRIGERSAQYTCRKAARSRRREGGGSLRRRCFLIVYPICPRKQGQSAGKTRPLTRTIPGPRDRACQRCIIGFLYAHVKCSSRTLAHNVAGREEGGGTPRPLWHPRLPIRVPGPAENGPRRPVVTRATFPQRPIANACADRNRFAGLMVIARAANEDKHRSGGGDG